MSGTVLHALSVEDLGGTALTEFNPLDSPTAANAFYKDWLGQDCTSMGGGLDGAEVVVRDNKGRC